MKIAIVAPEAVPFSKTGGLADVAGTLYREYLDMGMDACLFVPLYRTTRERFGKEIRDTEIELDIPLGKAVRKCRVFENRDAGRGKGVVFFIANNEYFDRDELYGTPAGDYPDNDQRFTFFCKSVLEICIRFDLNVDVFHCNDWQTGLISLYLKTLYKNIPSLGNPLSVLTIHNLGYQGLFPPQSLEMTGLSPALFTPEGIEFYGKVNFLKAGIIGADIITTVSKTYAQEILTKELGFGLDGILRKRSDSLIGILNGIDYREWDPSSDRMIPRTFSASDLSGKAVCKKELMRQCALRGNPSAPLLCFIGRLSAQKGVDLLADILPGLIGGGVNIVIIGRGDKPYHTLLNSLGGAFPGSLYFCSDFNEPLAHLAYAGADMFLMPSQYEPCGLGQMIAMRYGTAPVARRTGGLADTIEDNTTGFLFDAYSPSALASSIRNALDAYASRKAWERIIKNDMDRDFSWGRSAETYLETYTKGLKAKR